MDKIYFDGTDLSVYGVFFDSSKMFVKPAKRTEKVTIPGRNGDLILSDNCFDNVMVDIPCFLRADFAGRFSDVINFLNSKDNQYRSLELSTDLSVFRRAVFRSAVEPQTGAFNKYGHFTLTFDCMPQMWLNDGSLASTFTKSGTITNPTRFASQPLIRAYGKGTFTVGDTTVQILRANTYTDIDCALMDCYKGQTPCNANVVFSGNDFPKIPSGTTTVTLGSGITRVDITPRWWKL